MIITIDRQNNSQYHGRLLRLVSLSPVQTSAEKLAPFIGQELTLGHYGVVFPKGGGRGFALRWGFEVELINAEENIEEEREYPELYY